ncbi:MAG: hypothetical protein QME12_04580 [Nanoarchaeota archaeon]|nr:hypothetical protein [Nanoarchaeota archaeon]
MKETGKFRTIEDKWFYPIIFIMGAYLIIRLIDQAKLMWIFPFDYTNDVSSFMAYLHFLVKYGYGAIAPEWFGGFSVLKLYSPAWSFFTLPLYWLTKNVQIATYLSMALLFALAGVFSALLGKTMGLSNAKKAALYFLLFANTVAISNFIRLGAMPTFFAWVFFIPFFCIILWYKDKPIDLRFYAFFIPSFAIMILSHPQETILAGIVLFSFFLAHKEKRKIAVASFASIVITSFWWFPFLRDLKDNSNLGTSSRTVETFWQFTGDWAVVNIALIASSIILLAAFALYLISKNKSRKEMLFFAPAGILAFFTLTNLITYIPYLNQLYHPSLIMLFLLYALYFFFSTDFGKLPKLAVNIAIIALILFPIANVAASHYNTPYFEENSLLSLEVKEILTEVTGPYMITSIHTPTAFPMAFYSYGAIYLNLSTPSGWSHEATMEWQGHLNRVEESITKEDCRILKEEAGFLGLKELISSGDKCNFFKRCGLHLKKQKNEVCLYTL